MLGHERDQPRDRIRIAAKTRNTRAWARPGSELRATIAAVTDTAEMAPDCRNIPRSPARHGRGVLGGELEGRVVGRRGARAHADAAHPAAIASQAYGREPAGAPAIAMSPAAVRQKPATIGHR